jgi:hypothetical protein
LGSDQYLQYLKGLFNNIELSVSHTVVCGEIGMKLYLQFLENIGTKIRQLQIEETVPFNVCEMLDEGQSKVRHVGAWAVRKVLENERKYVRQNMFSLSQKTSESVTEHYTRCTLLEENIIVPFCAFQDNTEYPETLQVTENRQYRKRGLLHISDNAFEFFLMLEQQRINTINESKLKQFKEDTVSNALQETKNNNELKFKWLSCFENLEVEEVSPYTTLNK